MRPVAWRKVIPVVQLAVYLALVWYGCWYRPTWQYWFEKWVSPATEPTGFVADWIDGIEPLPEQIAAGLNFPAVAAAALSLVPFEDEFHTGASTEIAMHALTALYLPLLWYAIGRRIDDRSGLGAKPLSKRSKALAVGVFAGLLLLGSLMLWSFAVGQRYTMASLSMLWIVSGLVAIGVRLRHWPSKRVSESRLPH